MSPVRALVVAAGLLVLGVQRTPADDACPRAVPRAAGAFLARSLGALAACRPS